MPASILTLLTKTVGVSVARFLLKHYLGGPARAVGGGLLETTHHRPPPRDCLMESKHA